MSGAAPENAPENSPANAPIKRIGVVLFNLGGPDSLSAVRPFLFNLFRDHAILRLPAFIRYPLAFVIARRRAVQAREIYAHMGGCSPILEQTKAQSRALEAALEKSGPAKVVIAMRYWHPFAREALQDLCDFSPDVVVALPLYPQFSTTTTESSFAEWRKLLSRKNANFDCRYVRSYAQADDFILAHADLINKAFENVERSSTRLLFSAHGLPQKIVDAGDPYPQEIEASCRAIVNKLNIQNLGQNLGQNLDWSIAYQSRVGPLKWIGPSLGEEIARAASDGVGLVVVPIAFVSEHSETLVELDHEYAMLAKQLGLKTYLRVPALGTHPLFIDALKKLVQAAVQTKD